MKNAACAHAGCQNIANCVPTNTPKGWEYSATPTHCISHAEVIGRGAAALVLVSDIRDATVAGLYPASWEDDGGILDRIDELA